MSLDTIRSVFDTRLVDWADAQVPPITVVIEGEAFDKPIDKQPFLQTFILPALTSNPSVSGEHIREIGIYQVNCWTYDDGRGTGDSEKLSKEVIRLFPVIPKFSNVSVERTPSISQPIPEDGWRVVPVTIQYRYESEYT